MALLEGMLALDRFVNELPASEKEYAAIVEKSKDDYGAFQALRFLLAINTDAWSDAVRSWKQLLSIGAVQIPPRPKGPSKASYIWRDRIILSQIQNLVSVGFHAQRNQETVGATSACDVISEATHMIGTGHSMNYGAVEAIWKKRADLQLPIAAASLFKIDPASYRKS
ncbi:hypothetical protein [Pseudotabrizicola sp.]|uniref:hypothetical protein n=1 Tax=Pseudotabrizicola sp. TaxID=2939647 RepID=UPI00271B557D|nr:hypothetical protein [Pseudotabrizicola sp.]MDO8881616.1 hypothetical protein [Pseudotabrizicola sp.]MDP2080526.1 hypothetical protein [Pseudotabrizicola sp.]